MWKGSRFWASLLGSILLLSWSGSAAALEMVFETDAETLKHFKIENPKNVLETPDQLVLYLRFIPLSGKPIEVGFPTKKNYITCDDEDNEDKRWELTDVSQGIFDRRHGMALYAFFFPRPSCKTVRFFVKPKLLE